MRLPGTRYQEHGWEQVRKLLGACSLQVLRSRDGGLALDQAGGDGTLDGGLDWYIDAVCAALRGSAGRGRSEAPGNSYGESVAELALALVCELRAQPSYWDAFVTALGRDDALAGGTEGIIRKKVNDMFSSLRDKVDADNYQATLGRACSPNKMYTYRMLDTAYHEIAALFAGWRQHQSQVAAILGRALDGIPIEVRQMKSISGCKAEWLIRWSATLERYGGAPGPLHTRSKRFASLKNSPDKIAAMMAEIGAYEELSANLDSAEDWAGDAGEAGLWLEDYWRVMHAPEADAGQSDQVLAAADDEFDGAADADGEAAAPDALSAEETARDEAAAGGVSLPLRYIALAGAAQQQGSWALRILKEETLAIRLAVYHTLLGSVDDSYPDEWRDPATGELPTLQQLAGLDGISMPTLRKRRNQAIARLRAAT
ncbi:hypothetical protein [Janthinobacterium agaricidamnosum]|uniref:Uncharacterized protein n=1 Tax=Janthinobacterium agaricidamnosum NBRC 102515 = DSM 9628 TaxID=1349767 RepID=W0V5U4_9BURK|nr:hypothetical protein [Janthinobacterium agaricidamnosum]CDG82637.1 hypothetical protein GJA_2001 [Janthinobacterium agaricidamnosum NBRC 102515 = DSM 9628]